MKGSIGSGSTVGISTGSIGTRASGTALGAKSLGGSFSPEARFGGKTSGFSSRGLSMFNREVISRPSASIVNQNYGKSVTSPHARTSGLVSPRGMFDISRPVRSSPISRHSEFGVSLNIKNGTERSSKTARHISFAPKGMFDLSRPSRIAPIERSSRSALKPVEFGKRITPVKAEQVRVPRISEKPVGKIDAFRYFPHRNRTVAERTLETGLNPRIRAERVKSILPFKDTIILWQRKDASSQMRPDTARRTSPAAEKNTQKIVEQFRKISLNKEVMSTHKPQVEAVYKVFKAKQEAKIKLKKERMHKIKRRKVGSMIKVLPDTNQDVKNLIFANIREAQKVAVPAIMKARQVSYGKALQEAVQILAKKHEGKIVITSYESEFQPDASLETQTSPSTDVKTKADKVVQEKGVDMGISVKTGSNNDTRNALRPTNQHEKPKEYYYFAKDKDANMVRKERITSAFKRLIASKANEDHDGKTEITGWDLQMALWENPKDNELSEITRPIQKDESLKRLLDTIKFLGHLTDLQMLHSILENLIERYSAIKLTKDKDEGMRGKDAEQIYGQALSFVPASAKGQREIGVLDAGSDTARLILLKQKGLKPKSQQIIYKEAA